MLAATTRGAGPDAILTAVLGALRGQGFASLTGTAAGDLANLPTPPAWTVTVTPRCHLRIARSGAAFYQADLGATVPPGWHDALTRRGALAVLLATGIDATGAHRTAQVTAAAQRGQVIAAQVPLELPVGPGVPAPRQQLP